MTTIHRVEDLEVFQLAHSLTRRVYEVSRRFPRDERFGLTSQLRRAAASVCANPVEGGSRLTRADYRRFVGIAKGSAGETAYHLLLARDLGYLDQQACDQIRNDYDRVERLLAGLARALDS